MLWFICFFNYADRMAINAVATVWKQEYHFTNEQFGWIASAFMYVYALGAPLAGQVGDRFPRKPLILGGLLVGYEPVGGDPPHQPDAGEGR